MLPMHICSSFSQNLVDFLPLSMPFWHGTGKNLIATVQRERGMPTAKITENKNINKNHGEYG